ncbi:MAG: hypothetical protein JO125_07385 [Chloroflexi bacterium]|nr:hypothetical protein [Chloroflexota bacterium]
MDVYYDEETQPMHQMNPKSEVARLLQQITLEYEAAQRGLSGLAYGTAQHKFIEARTERIAQYSLTLRQQVGDQEAFRLLSEIEQQ